MCPKLCCKDTRIIDKMAVETCSKAIFALSVRHGKNPCFLRYDFLKVVDVDDALLVFSSVDGGNLLEYAL